MNPIGRRTEYSITPAIIAPPNPRINNPPALCLGSNSLAILLARRPAAIIHMNDIAVPPFLRLRPIGLALRAFLRLRPIGLALRAFLRLRPIGLALRAFNSMNERRNSG